MRREKNCLSHNLFLDEKEFSEISCADDTVVDIHRTFKTRINNDLGKEKEVVLIFSEYALKENLDVLFYMFQSVEYDKTTTPDDDNDIIRGRHSVSVWNRNQLFRKKILDLYNQQCAICRCNEKDILEAAHIKAVADYGSDKSSNGICLCRNHHRMYDKEIIKIDFKKNELSFVKDTVKVMPWYKQFVNEYKGKIINANKQ